MPVDISGEFLAEQAEALKREFPHIAMLPVAADFTRPFELPATIQNQPRVGFFPGSTIGNFEPHEAAAFLKDAGDILGRRRDAHRRRRSGEGSARAAEGL